MIASLAAASLAVLSPVQAELKPGAPQRRAVLEALRPAIETKLEGRVEFVVQDIRTGGGWAFVMADPQRPGGRPIDGAALFPADWENMDGLTVTAVLRFQNRRWNLVDYAIGATDVWYCDLGPRALKQGIGC